jgi:hypothetical protein
MSGAAVAGMDSLVTRYYLTRNNVERTMLREIMIRGIKLDGDRREDQANRIIMALDRALSKKRSVHQHGA